jgi:hypothetical protein
MKKKILVCLSACLIGVSTVNATGIKLKSNSLIKNGHGLVEAGSWVNMKLQTPLIVKQQVQTFTAKTVDPVYNHDFSEVLIPANSIVSGEYNNDGDFCSFSINKISFKDTEIQLKQGAYSTVSATLPNQPACNPEMAYMAGQLLEFQTKVDIPNLDVIANIKQRSKVSHDNFIEAYGNSQYVIKDISRFDNGLMQIEVQLVNVDIKDKLVPVYYDDYGIAHGLNYQLTRLGNSEYSYLMLSNYDSFGFGIKE